MKASEQDNFSKGGTGCSVTLLTLLQGNKSQTDNSRCAIDFFPFRVYHSIR